MLTKTQVKNSYMMVGLKGLTVTCMNEDGEVEWTVGLTAGCHSIAALARFMRGNVALIWEGDGEPLDMSGERIGVFDHPGRSDSGANPSFIPQRMTQAEVRMRGMLDSHMRKVNEKLNRRKKQKAKEVIQDDEELQVVSSEEQEPKGETKDAQKKDPEVKDPEASQDE